MTEDSMTTEVRALIQRMKEGRKPNEADKELIGKYREWPDHDLAIFNEALTLLQDRGHLPGWELEE